MRYRNELEGRSRVYNIDVSLWLTHEPSVTFYRKDASGGKWNHTYYGTRVARKWLVLLLKINEKNAGLGLGDDA